MSVTGVTASRSRYLAVPSVTAPRYACDLHGNAGNDKSALRRKVGQKPV